MHYREGIGGLAKVSLVDYPGKVVAVIFLNGCNFICPYCHNMALLSQKPPVISWENEVVPYLRKRQGILDGVVVSGGEPTIYPDVLNLLECIKDLGYQVKLDTNGSRPDVVHQAIDEKLVDYVAMDIKTLWSKYHLVWQNPDVDKIQATANILLSGNVDYQFRTTVAPLIVELNDICDIVAQVAGAKHFVLQQFQSQNWFVGSDGEVVVPYEASLIKENIDKCRNLVQELETINL